MTTESPKPNRSEIVNPTSTRDEASDSLGELVERLEKTTDPSIVLDAEIYCATHDNCERDGGRFA